MNHNSGLGGPGYIEFITRDNIFCLFSIFLLTNMF